jgi:hypothetical protein
VQRDVPEPAVAARGLDHDGGAFVSARISVGPLPVGPDGPFVEDGIPDPQAEPVLDEPRLAARVHDDLGPHVSDGAVLGPDLDPDGPAAFERHVEHAHALVDDRAVLTRVFQHHLVELAPLHLPGLRALVGLVVPEVEGCGELAVGIDELHAVLLHEMTLLHLRQHAETLQHPVGLGDQRFPDVEPRKPLALEELHPKPLVREQGGGGGAGRTASDHDDVRSQGLFSRIDHQLRSSRAG